MLNDKLDSSYSPAGQRSFNKRLKDLEGKVSSLDANVTTEELNATEANIGKLNVEEINLTGEFNAENGNINNIKSDSIEANNINTNEINTNTITFKTASGEEIEVDKATINDIKSDIANIIELTSTNATIDNLTVNNIIEELNLKLLKINDKLTLNDLAGILQFGTEYDNLQIQTTNRPKWKELEIVTQEQLNTPFKLIGVVNETTDLPTTANEGDTYLVNNNGSPLMAVYIDNTWNEIPYPVLQMYRTADDQNIIDQALQDSIANTKVDVTNLEQTVNDNKTEFDNHVKSQNTINQEVQDKFTTLDEDINGINDNLDKKLSDAPIDGQIYGRRNGQWQNIVTEGAYVPKHYEKVEKYFSNIILEKDPAYLETSELVTIEIPLQDGNTSTKQYYLALWHLKPSNEDDFAYTTKNAFEFINNYKDKVSEAVYNAIMEAYNSEHIIGMNNKKEFQTLDWLDVEQPFGTSKEGDTIERPDGAVLGTNDITSDDNGIDINSSMGFTANTPTITSDEKSVINRKYIRDNLKLSTSSSSSGASSAVLSYGKTIIDDVSDRVYCYQPNALYNQQWTLTFSPWMHRTKDYVYYKVDNSENQGASSFSFWLSLDKNGNVINMTNPREDRGNAVAGQSDSEMWMTYHPSSWNGVNDNYAYWPHTHETYGGYITIFNNGRFVGYVEDANGNSNNVYTCNTTSQSVRWVGGKSLRGDKQRILMVNSSSAAKDNVKALIIGVDSNNEEGLNKCKPVQLPSLITWGVLGLAAGKKHFFAQSGTTNSFMVISNSGAVASYVLADPTTYEALGTEVLNDNRNYIELQNGDCIFMVRDTAAKQCYFIYCNDNFEEEGIDPFTVYRCSIDYIGSSKWLLAGGNPFVEHGNFVYFFPTLGENFGDTWAWPANVTLTSTYSRFNKTTKSWSDALLNWTNSSNEGSGIKPVMTHDPVEDADYLWVFQSTQAESTTAPTQSQCLVISESGSSQYVDLGTGSSIHWFNNTVKSGETLLSTYSYPLNPSGNPQWALSSQVRGQVPYAAATEEGIGIMLSNAGRDVCIFYGNGHFAIYSYQETNEGGPWSYFSSGSGYGPAFIGGKYGCKLYITFNNNLNIEGGETASSQGVIYIKPTGSDYLGEPQYFWKPLGYGMDRQYWAMNDGMDYMETDFSKYRKGVHEDGNQPLTSIRPAMGGWHPRRGMTNWETETITSSSTLYLKDGNDNISSVSLKL